MANLLDHAGEGRVQLQAHHTARGELATGITFTAFTGMADYHRYHADRRRLLVERHDGMCKGGIITMAVSAPLLAGSIWLILDSRARAEIIFTTAGCRR